MKFFIQLIGLLTIITGILFLVYPGMFLNYMEIHVADTQLYYSAIFFRFIFGALLIFAAKESRHPVVIKFIGALAIIAAIVFLVLGHEKFISFISRMLSELSTFSFLGGIAGITLGTFLIYSFRRF